MRRLLILLGIFTGLVTLTAPPAHAGSLSWTIPSTGVSGYTSAAYGAGQYVILGGSADTGLTSADGTNFSPLSTGVSRQVRDVIYAGGQFVGSAAGGVSCCNALSSTDGLNWTGRATASSTQDWISIAYGNGRYVVVNAGNGGPSVNWSSNGTTWNNAATNIGGSQVGVAFGNGIFVAVDQYGNVHTSTDGNTWTSTTQTGVHANDITFGDGTFMIVDDYAQNARSSTDGMTWTSAASMPAASWKSVAFGGGYFVAVADGGDVAMSADGSTWVEQSKPLGNVYLSNVSYANGRFFIFSATGPNRVAIGLLPSDGQTPPPWRQAYATSVPDSCPAGWGNSWQEWPNGGTGGFVCIRSLVYQGNEWNYVPGFA